MNIRRTKTALLNLVIFAVSLSYGYLDWFFNRQFYKPFPSVCFAHLHGGLDAPIQYRVGVWLLVCRLHVWLHMSLWLALTAVDVAALVLLLWCLVGILRENPVYTRLSPTSRLLSFVGMFFLVEYSLVWGHWYQYPETIPSCLFVCVSALLISAKAVKSRFLSGVFLVGLSCIQGLIRADVAVILHAGFLLGACLPFAKNMPLGRLRQVCISLLAATVAGGIQVYLMRVQFPSAKYGSAGVFQIVANLHPMQWMTALLGLFPFWLLLWLVGKRFYRPDSVTAVLLISSLLYLAVWCMVGLIDEVRIFLPFAIVLLPATALALSEMLVVTPSNASVIP